MASEKISKKELRKNIQQSLTSALSEYKNGSEKKFDSIVWKVTRELASGLRKLHRKSTKKNRKKVDADKASKSVVTA